MRFAGEQGHRATGLYNLRPRLYDPGTGRFTARDPLAADVGSPYPSAYAYVDGRPTAQVDPIGERGRAVGGVEGIFSLLAGPLGGGGSGGAAFAPCASSPSAPSPLLAWSLGGLFAGGGASCAAEGGKGGKGGTKLETKPVPIPVPPIGPQFKIGGGECDAPQTGVDRSCAEHRMRFQVQWDTSGSNVVFSEVVVAVDPSVGVTVVEAAAAMHRLQAQVRPRNAARAAQPAFDRALGWIANRPPAGVSNIGNVHSSYFSYQRFTDARVDVENLSGTNLRQ